MPDETSRQGFVFKRFCAVADKLQRCHDLAAVIVGFHVVERLADVCEFVDLVDHQPQLARRIRGPNVLAYLVEDLADLLDRAGAEGDADMLFTRRRRGSVQVMLLTQSLS
ncbi:hypothetical protein WDM22_14820 [Bradyrhizobium septentrionale]|nr:hypothetical protein [Bradyrhizobium septentrionale]UGY13171.1 hypothetical protein HAP48_0031850 [Bradyrhizobium septentrionale]UGY21791.1 hypothetical protein HU675_0027670 [Bradyrhizobium septentrionale]